MSLVFPKVGDVINYGYLWRHEADDVREEGRKYRPGAVVVATGEGFVAVMPITHLPPVSGTTAIQLLLRDLRRLGFHDSVSWLITSEVSIFYWPGTTFHPSGVMILTTSSSARFPNALSS